MGVIALIASISGCATKAEEFGDYAGSYSSTYTRVALGGTINIAVTPGGQVDYAVSDSAAGVFFGTAAIDSTGHFAAVVNQNNQTYNLSATVVPSKTAAQRQVVFNVTGDITLSATLQYQDSPSTASYAGSYSGTYNGDLSGNWNFTFGSNGHIVGGVTNGNETLFNVSGNFSAAGAGQLTGQGSGTHQGETMTWTGMCVLSNGQVSCTGIWSTSATQAGTWQGSRSN
ncbi:MAG: hypothetical protein JST51_02275 [Armatimonadetes bacterium]|nr:hypothetical protein [Armatimonadota bacterium]